MILIDENTTRQDLEDIILCELPKADYRRLIDEDRFFGRHGTAEYTVDELRAIVTGWIAAGDECGGCA